MLWHESVRSKKDPLLLFRKSRVLGPVVSAWERSERHRQSDPRPFPSLPLFMTAFEASGDFRAKSQQRKRGLRVLHHSDKVYRPRPSRPTALDYLVLPLPITFVCVAGTFTGASCAVSWLLKDSSEQNMSHLNNGSLMECGPTGAVRRGAAAFHKSSDLCEIS